MRIPVAAAPVLLALVVAMPARALDDTPTQTPFLSSKADELRAPSATPLRAPAARRIELLDEPRRPLRAALAAPAPAAVAMPPAGTAPAPLAPALPSAGKSAALAERSIGLR